MTKTAVILFNLGGPDSPEAVEPFLFNLFSDPAIIRLPKPLRWLVAKLISRRRAPVARDIYAKIGGKSPLLEGTLAQAAGLEQRLGPDFKVLVAMRYWHPFADEAARQAKEWGAERVLLLPLYPQYSTTTSASSIKDWERAAEAVGLKVPTKTICCFPTQAGFIAAMAGLLRQALTQVTAGQPRVLFSAHGLPKKVVDAGDPYAFHVKQSAEAVVRELDLPDLDWRVSYQSRVGPMEWIGPYTDAEIEAAGREGKPLVIVPIAFVSEHSETLVELDLEYGHLAQEHGVPQYVRVPTVGVEPAFLDGLADLSRRALEGRCNPFSQNGYRICPASQDGRDECPNVECPR